MVTVFHSIVLESRCYSKSIDYTPDFAADEYWASHSIGLMRVAAIERDGRDKVTISFGPIAIFSGEFWRESRLIAASDLWFGIDDVPRPQPLRQGDQVVAIRSDLRVEPIVIVFANDAAEHARLVRRLERIRDLRSADFGKVELRGSPFDADEIVSRFALARMLAGRDPRDSEDLDYAKKLEELADDEATPGSVRALAAQLMFRIHPSWEGSTEPDWLRNSIEISRSASHIALRPLQWRCLDFPDQRLNNAECFIRLATDRSVRGEARLAAFDAFDDERLFKPAHPDATSDAIFRTCERALRDTDTRVRIAASGCLSWICNRVGNRDEPRRTAEYVRKYVNGSRSSLVSAIAAEQDEVARLYMATDLSTVSSRIILPP